MMYNSRQEDMNKASQRRGQRPGSGSDHYGAATMTNHSVNTRTVKAVLYVCHVEAHWTPLASWSARFVNATA